jgi:hypothetical protein
MAADLQDGNSQFTFNTDVERRSVEARFAYR